MYVANKHAHYVLPSDSIHGVELVIRRTPQLELSGLCPLVDKDDSVRRHTASRLTCAAMQHTPYDRMHRSYQVFNCIKHALFFTLPVTAFYPTLKGDRDNAIN